MRLLFDETAILDNWFDPVKSKAGWFDKQLTESAAAPPGTDIYKVTEVKTLWTSATTAYNVTAPGTLTENDVIWIQFQNADTVGSFTSTPGADWFEGVPVLHASGGNMITAWYHVVTAAEEASPPSTFNFVWANSLAGNALLSVFRNVDPSNVLDVAIATVTNGTTTKTVPSITTVTDGAYVFGGGQLQSATSQSINVPSGWTQILTSCGDSAGRGGVIGYKGVQAIAGATGTAAFTQTQALQGYAYQAALRPNLSGGLTQVNKDLQLVWNDFALATKNLQLIWNDRSLVTKNLQLVWTVNSLVTKSIQMIWNDRSLASKSLQTIWNDYATAGKDLQIVWNVLVVGLTPVGKDLQLVWNVRAVVNKDVQYVWNVRATIAKNVQLLWNDRSLVGKDLQLVWNMRSVAGQNLQVIWNDRSLVSKTVQTFWNVNSLAGKNLQLVWNDRAAVAKSLQLLWNTLDLGLTPVGKDLVLLWNVLPAWTKVINPTNIYAADSGVTTPYAADLPQTDTFIEEPPITPGLWTPVVEPTWE